MKNPQTIILDIYKILSPFVNELLEKKYTKYLSSKICGNITTTLDLLVTSHFCKMSKIVYD